MKETQIFVLFHCQIRRTTLSRWDHPNFGTWLYLNDDLINIRHLLALRCDRLPEVVKPIRKAVSLKTLKNKDRMSVEITPKVQNAILDWEPSLPFTQTSISMKNERWNRMAKPRASHFCSRPLPHQHYATRLNRGICHSRPGNSEVKGRLAVYDIPERPDSFYHHSRQKYTAFRDIIDQI